MTTSQSFTLDQLNAIAPDRFVAALGGVFEHAPWVAAAASARRPFASLAALHAAMCEAVTNAGPTVQRDLLNAHPDLGGLAARRSAMAALSVEEQASLGLQALDTTLTARLDALNAAYRARFAIPFIICVRRHTLGSIIESFERRLTRSAEAEHDAALAEIFHITALRLQTMVAGATMVTDGWLSTHVLDTATGRPAVGMAVELFELGETAPILRARAVTNADGRTDAPLIAQGALRIGAYEVRFNVGAYFAGLMGEPPFLGIVPIRFGVAEPESHYHVPLLVSPGAYSTYRGS